MKTSENPRSDRRQFLQTATASVIPLGLASRLAAQNRVEATQPVGVYRGAPVFLHRLEALRSDESFGDRNRISFFRYRSRPGYRSDGALPRIDAPEKSIVVAEITNQLSIPILPELRGLQRGAVIPPKTRSWFAFRVPRAGTWLLEEAGLQKAAGPMGFGAVVVSRPSSGKKELWNGGPAFDREYVLLYQDCDDRWNREVAAGRIPNWTMYEPNYFTLGGLSYPGLAKHADTRIVCRLGERVLLRLGNLGHVRQSIHFHGFHVEIAARNNVPEFALPPKDTIPLPPGQTIDVLLKATQRGLFPVHPHFVPAVTANGLYPFGALTMIEVR